MISKDKTYRTRDGREVRIYAIDGRGDYPIHGAIKTFSGWEAYIWLGNGRAVFNDETERDTDLIEVKPRIRRTVWLNVFDEGVGAFEIKCAADTFNSRKRLACVKVEIDCEEGEGL